MKAKRVRVASAIALVTMQMSAVNLCALIVNAPDMSLPTTLILCCAIFVNPKATKLVFVRFPGPAKREIATTTVTTLIPTTHPLLKKTPDRLLILTLTPLKPHPNHNHPCLLNNLPENELSEQPDSVDTKATMDLDISVDPPGDRFATAATSPVLSEAEDDTVNNSPTDFSIPSAQPTKQGHVPAKLSAVEIPTCKPTQPTLVTGHSSKTVHSCELSDSSETGEPDAKRRNVVSN